MKTNKASYSSVGQKSSNCSKSNGVVPLNYREDNKHDKIYLDSFRSTNAPTTKEVVIDMIDDDCVNLTTNNNPYE